MNGQGPQALTILTIASPFVEIGPDAAGGSEQIAYRIDEALALNGHRSIVVACEESEIHGKLVPVRPIRHERAHIKRETWDYHRGVVEDTLSRVPVDLVHIHAIDFFEVLPSPGVPVLVTLHMPPFWYPPGSLEITRPKTWFHGVSWTQHRSFSGTIALMDPIPNGVPKELLASRHAERDFFLFLGRICAEKGVDIALEAARRSGQPLLVAGEVFPFEEHLRYMAVEVETHLDASRRFIGKLGFARKRRFLSAARGVLLPAREPETSCLVAMEALACGTPVIAFPAGELREIVRHGENGFLVNDAAEMAAAMKLVHEIDREACRTYARDHFSLDAMTDRYLARYRSIVDTGTEPSGTGPG